MKHLMAAVLLLFASSAMAQGTAPNPPGPVMQSAPYLSMPTGTYQQFSPATAQGLPNIPQNANYAVLICSSQGINWTDDGTTTPTSSIGMPLAVSSYFIFAERPLSQVKVIQQASSATCNVSYYQ